MGILKNINVPSQPTHSVGYLFTHLKIYLLVLMFQNASMIMSAILLAPGVSEVVASLFYVALR